MVEFSKFELENGLRVIVHEDDSTPMVAVNVLYNVGARDESPDKTGLAHLFEHIMFGGSLNVPNFDYPLQMAGGENNAFTNNDFTNFYDYLPAQNLEIALWLESDRMLGLDFDEETLSIQQKVVIEEFKENCLNMPYGDVWHHINDMAFTTHPYRWPTIGKVPKHVEDATIDDIKDFYHKYYNPNNAILALAGSINVERAKELVEKWFGDIPSGPVPNRNLPVEPPQVKLQQRINEANVPVDALYLAFHAPGRDHETFYTTDIITDILATGPSSRLFRKVLKEQKAVSTIDCYLTGSIDPGLLVIEARPGNGQSLETVEKIIWKELELLKTELVTERELTKVKNKVESSLLFSELNVLDKAVNLSFFELLGDADIINKEFEYYREIKAAAIQDVARMLFTEENCCRLYYKAK